MSEGLRLLLLVLGGLTVVLVVVLVVVRVLTELIERVTARRQDEVRRLLLTALLGEADESADALTTLRSREGRSWRRVEEQAFTMLPKIKGDSRELLVTLLLSRGAAYHAHANATARSMVRRSRGAHQLGALGQSDGVRVLLGLLEDRRFLVRRTTVRGLGQVGDPISVVPLLDAVTTDPALTRDVIAALQRIGPPAAPYLRRELRGVRDALPLGRRAALVATALGLLGDVRAADQLVEALGAGQHPGLPAAAAEALGQIGVPAAVPALVAALRDESEELRVSAARALGQISDAAAVDGLVAALGSDRREADRAAAAALLRLGASGLRALEAHPSQYAAEALAVHRIRAAA